MKTIYKEINNLTLIYTYKFVGYGIDAQSVYAEYITIFSITEGIITNTEFTGRYIDCNGNQVFFFR